MCLCRFRVSIDFTETSQTLHVKSATDSENVTTNTCHLTENTLFVSQNSDQISSICATFLFAAEHILPDPIPNNHTYNLRPRRHELTLAIKGDAKNVFERELFKDIY